MHSVVRPAFLAFVLLAPACLIGAAAVFAVRGDWWSTAVCAAAAATPASLIPRERSLRRQGRGQGRLYGELREAVAAGVPAGQTRLLRRYGDPVFYAVGRRQGEEVVLLGGLEAFEDLDGALSGRADHPGGFDSGLIVLAFERKARQAPADDPAGFVSRDRDASAFEVLDYWREGVIPTVHYSPLQLPCSHEGTTRTGRFQAAARASLA